MSRKRRPKSVTVPDDLVEKFARAESFVEEYFKTARRLPAEGKFLIGNQRYVALPAEFVTAMRERIALAGSGELADLIVYEVAKEFGRLDARDYRQRMKVTDPVDMLAAGAVQFSFRGFAHIHIFPESRITSDESYVLIYDYLNSFEVEALLREGRRAETPRCFFNAGYSAGWCEESFGIPLQAREIACRAVGDPFCRFVMAHEKHLLEHITPDRVAKYRKLQR